MNDPRYQHQSWLVRRWRDRYNLLVPFTAVRYWICDQMDEPEEDEHRMSFAICWDLASGSVDVKKKHYFSGEELGHGFKKYADDE